MRPLLAWFRRLAGLFQGRSRERELAAELESHLEMHVADNLRAGMDPEKARREALLKLGGLEQAKESYRERSTFRGIESFVQDVRFGLRMLRKNPAFTLVAVLTLMLGIGANTAIFSVVQAVLLKPLPYPDASRLMFLREYQIGGNDMSVSWLNFLDWRAQSRVFEAMSAYQTLHLTLTGHGDPVLTRGAQVSASFFPLLGVAPTQGRDFTASDDQAGAAAVVILSGDFWERRLGSDPSVIGKIIALDGKSYTVVGVLGPEFKEPIAGSPIDLYLPVGLSSSKWQNRDQRGSLAVIARLRPGISLSAARSEMDTIEERLEQQFPKTNHRVRASVTTLYDERFGDFRPLLYTLLAAVGVVLLIACANVANLSIARSLGRRREFGIRRACGAGRSRLIRQLLVESTLVSCLAGVAGLLPAWWALRLIIRLAPGGIPRLQETHLDGRVLAFTLTLSILTGMLAGLGPGLSASRPDVADIVKDGGTSTGRATHRWQSSLLLAETALAVVVVVASGLLARSLIKAQEVNPGFNPDHVLVLEVVLPGSGYATPAQRVEFYRQVEARLNGLPGVKSTGMVVCPPAIGHCWDWFYTVDDHPAPPSGNLPVSAFNQASPSYFQTMGVPLLAGRYFTEQDDSQSPPVVIVNQTFARSWWPNANPIGRRVRLWDARGTTPYREIVGVAADIREDGVDAEQIPEVFIPAAQRPTNGMTFVMRTSVDPGSLLHPAAEAIHTVDKNLPIERAQPMARYLESSLATRRFTVILVAFFAVAALILAAIGIYGLTSYSAGQRTHEIGIRMALGAKRSDVLRAVANRGVTIAGAGIVLGAAGALAATRALSNLLFGVGPADPATFVGVCCLLGVVAIAASYIPALRATRLNPTTALRHE